MMTTHAQDREETFRVLGAAGASTDTIRAILAKAGTFQRLAVTECNRELTDKERLRMEKLGEQITALAATFHAKTKLGGDPRGYCVKLLLRTGKFNTWGGAEEGWGIPARG